MRGAWPAFRGLCGPTLEFQEGAEYTLSIRGFDGQMKVAYARTHEVDGAIVHSFVTDDPPAVDVFLVPEDLIGTVYFFPGAAAV